MNKCCVLLVGGTGFIGRALAQKLADEGYEVHVLGRSQVYGLPDSVRIHQVSQDDPAVIEPLFGRGEPCISSGCIDGACRYGLASKP